MSTGFPFRTVAVAVLLVALAPSTAKAAAIKVACLGASTTSGDGSTAGHHFPDELRIALGAGYQVQNFGVSGTTALKSGDSPYWKFPQLNQAVAYQPDIAIFWFGGNDAKPQNWTGHMAEFITDFETMVRMVQASPSHPKTYLFRSMVIHDVEGIPKMVLEQQVLPEVGQVAAATGSVLINYHDAFIIHPEYFPDGVHPNDAGTAAIGMFVAKILLAPTTLSDGGADDASPCPGSSGCRDGGTVSPGNDGAVEPSADAQSPSTIPAGSVSGSSSGGGSGSAGGLPAAAGSNAGSASGIAAGSSNGSLGAGSSGSGGYGSSNSTAGGCTAVGSGRSNPPRELGVLGFALAALLARRRKRAPG